MISEEEHIKIEKKKNDAEAEMIDADIELEAEKARYRRDLMTERDTNGKKYTKEDIQSMITLKLVEKDHPINKAYLELRKKQIIYQTAKLNLNSANRQYWEKRR